MTYKVGDYVTALDTGLVYEVFRTKDQWEITQWNLPEHDFAGRNVFDGWPRGHFRNDEVRPATDAERDSYLASAYKRICSGKNIEELISALEHRHLDGVLDDYVGEQEHTLEQATRVNEAVAQERQRPEPRPDVLETLRHIAAMNSWSGGEFDDLESQEHFRRYDEYRLEKKKKKL